MTQFTLCLAAPCLALFACAAAPDPAPTVEAAQGVTLFCGAGAPECIGWAVDSACGSRLSPRLCFFAFETDDGVASCTCTEDPQ
jgi:hypothetical protein